MAVTPANIGWGSYTGWEGPYFGGRQLYKLPDVPEENDRIMNVVTAAEGGHYDAINMYDAGIVSVGLIQWINAGQHSVDAMLGRVVEDCGEDKVLVPLADAMKASGATFKKNAAGQWRFFNAEGEVNTDSQQRRLFMAGCGPKGAWNDAAKLHAKVWAAGFANVFADPGAQKAQVDYTVPRLREFLFGDLKTSMYDGTPDEGWTAAARAAVISFAVNMPGRVAPLCRSYLTTTKHKKWSSDWVIGLLKYLTFNGPSTGIWLRRYDEIRPVLEKLYGIKLPRSNRELSLWQPTGTDVPATPPPRPPVLPPEPVPVPVEPTPVPVPEPEPTPTPAPAPAPIVPVKPDVVPAWKSIVDFIMMIINMFLKRKQ